jgi:superfamily II DNA or RNA helicase
MEEFIMASKYIMSRLLSNFYYPDEYRSTNKPAARDELHHVGRVLKYRYKPTGEVNDSKKYFVNMLYNFELQRLKLDKSYKAGKLSTPRAKKIMTKVKNEVKKNVVIDYELQNIGWVDKGQFTDHKLTDVYSRKMAAVITNIVSNWKAKHVLFTFYKTKAGVNMLHALFKMCGVKTAIYSGDISDSQRKKILKEFNSEKNRYGDKIKVLLVTEAGAEGINILEAQHMHILESSTREMKIQQAIGRVVRYRSHMVEGRSPMPKNEQVVHIWRYWSISDPAPYTIKRTYVDNEGQTKTSKKIIVDKTCVDEILYKQGIFAVNTMQSFLDLVKKASVTSYEKEQDKDSRLKDYGVLKPSPELEAACEISKERYMSNADKIVRNTDINTSDLIHDLGGVTDEEK